MESILSTLAFALLIGGQFLAVIVLNSNREAIYSEPEESPQHRPRPSKGPRMELAQIRYFVALCGERSSRRSGREQPEQERFQCLAF